MPNQSVESDFAEANPPPQPAQFEAHKIGHGANTQAKSLIQASLEQEVCEDNDQPDSSSLSEPSPDPDLTASLVRPPHSGWEPTTINMAKCDYCDQRRRGTLYRCCQCQIAICKDCFEKGILDHDTKHSLDVDMAKWDLHSSTSDKSDKKTKKKAIDSTTKPTTTTRSRASTRSRAAPRGRAKKPPIVSQAAALENEQSLEELRAEPLPMINDEDQEQHQAGLVLEALSQRQHALSQGTTGEQAICSPKPIEPAFYYQSELCAPKPQRPVERQVSVIDAMSGTRKPLPSSALIGEASRNDHFHPATNTMNLHPILPRPIHPRFNPYEQHHHASNYQQNRYRFQSQNITPGQRSQRERDRNYRTHPYRSPREEYDITTRHGAERRRAYQLAYGYDPTPTQSGSIQPQRSVTEDRLAAEYYNIDPRLSNQPLEGIQRSAPTPQHQSYGIANSPLPPIRCLEQPLRGAPTQTPNSFLSSQQQQGLPDWNESIIHRLGYQLEVDALVTRDENPNWALDECLRHETNRVWTRRNAPTSLLQEAIRQDPSAGKDDVGIAFRTLLSAHYLAGIRLRLELRNAARNWIIETQNQLVADGLMTEPRATLVWGRLN
ncbi:hypothetical protein BGZ63DRAFT_402348 [Mariannaea sp. PMI_226]|nr:hypothetical protein BGZ63DRAFT_402348 [Mariannaea sp. PMI_226]